MTSSTVREHAHIAEIRDGVLALRGQESLDPLIERIGDARYVLLGEASHGTAEYYRLREMLTSRLIMEKGFSFVAVEGDWPDCESLHCCVTAAPGAPDDPLDVLEHFDRWPTWMWANTDVARFSRWLRAHNEGLAPENRVGFFGLDVYSLWESLHAVLDYLAEHFPERVGRAVEAYRCFEPYAEDPQSYALSTRLIPSGCQPEVLGLLVQLRREAEQANVLDRSLSEFSVRQNAEVLSGAERYYRAMLHGGSESWNIRDHHMADTLDRLMEFHGPGAKAVVWEHNTHVGDARATDMASAGMVNIGRLVRERHSADGVVLVGFGSYAGTLIASDAWGGSPTVMVVPPAREESVEGLLHSAELDGAGLFVFPRADDGRQPYANGASLLRKRRDHRAIGVVYHPEREKWGNYVSTLLGARYDAFCFLDRTTALTPLHTTPGDTLEAETWPTGVQTASAESLAGARHGSASLVNRQAAGRR